ncbi:MAG: hypothetical protein RDV41_02025, partial [Planctomycetota bacterium]|nr:hypothetical protein [Planctomycetota bacterium]
MNTSRITGASLFLVAVVCFLPCAMAEEELEIPAACADAVKFALEAAGPNRGELIAALKAAKEMSVETPDALEAMCFLVAQTPHRGFLKGELKRDCNTITAALLVSNLKGAIAARNKYPWCGALDREAWSRFVLPYRGTT